MIPTATGLIVIALGVWCQLGSFRRALISTVLLTIFEAADAADMPALGGASITPAKLFMLFLVLRAVSMRGGFGALCAELSPRRVLFLYFLLLLWAVPSAVLLPRLFQDSVQVFSLERSVIDSGLVPLKPSSGNITQTVNALGSLATAVLVSALARRPGGYEAVLKALMILTGMNIGFALLDLVTAATHTGFLLDVIHTGAYAFLTDDESAGLKRISGSFAEASAFATFSLDLLAVNLTLFVLRVRPGLTGFYSLALVALLLLSTSSTAYAGLAVFALGFAAYAAWSLLVRDNARALKILVLLGLAGTFFVCATVVLAPGFAAAAWNVIDVSVLQKSQSDSALERGSFNIQAGKLFVETDGLGVGLGATRTSNYIYLLLSNLGAIGIALFAIFVLALAFMRPRDDLATAERRIVAAARVGALGALVPATLIATIFDLGPLFYVLVGITASGAAAIGPAQIPATEGARRRLIPRSAP